MIELGACVIEDTSQMFHFNIAPISDQWDTAALAVSGRTREETKQFADAHEAMRIFVHWLNDVSNQGEYRLVFVSDNPIFDGMFVWYYLDTFYCSVYNEPNPFGHSGISITSLYKGLKKDMRASFKHLRTTKHTHNALDDALGNAEAYNAIMKEMGS